MARGLGGGRHAFILQAAKDKFIDAVANPLFIFDAGKFHFAERPVGPVGAPLRALRNPLADERDGRCIQRFAFVRRRHQFIGILGREATKQFAGLGLAGDNSGFAGF